jgi:hypothetical protein
MPTGTTMTSTHIGQLDITPCGLLLDATAAHLFPELTDYSLISVGKLCNHGCDALFSRHEVRINKDGNTILQGTRNSNGLWIMNLTEGNNKPVPQVPIQQHIMAMASTTMQDHIQFLHAGLFSPVKSTLLKAIRNGHLATFPGLTVANVNKFLPKSMATSKGHLNQTRKNVRST